MNNPTHADHSAPETDYATVVAPQTVRLQRRLPGPIERVWDYLADSDLRRQWLAAGDMTGGEASSFELVWRNDELTDPPGNKPEGFGAEHRMRSTITAFDPPHRLAFTWGDAGSVEIELERAGADVLLTLVHRGISDHRNLLMIGAGWHMHLAVLVARVSGTTPEPFWDGWGRLHAEYGQRIPA
ncbi:MAG: SRPBCC family protein [Pseudomonadota bacterium]|nr:SRPBCC family protein [Pseudomonadota bacterium]